MFDLDTQVRRWRDHMRSRSSLGARDLEELESHLLDAVEDLEGKGISQEEAFLLSIRRMGDAEAVANEFAKVTTERVWRQLLEPVDSEPARSRARFELFLVLGLALAAVVAGRIPALFGQTLEGDATGFGLNVSLFALLPVAVYLSWKRSLPRIQVAAVIGAFFVFELIVNLYPSYAPEQTRFLTMLHLPLALGLLLLVPYAGAGWRRSEQRLDFVRFAGEAFIYCVLIFLGVMVLATLSVVVFEVSALDVNDFVIEWVVVSALWALPVVAAYLVERKMGRIESIAPVLARLFVPLFLVLTVSLLVAIAVTGNLPGQNRDTLIAFDVLLAVVLGLVIFTMSARDTEDGPGGWDRVVTALLIAALVADGFALGGIVGRLSSFGFSANKAAALGENLLLLVNLAGLAAGYWRFSTGRLPYKRIVRLQMTYLPVYAAWAAIVALGFPPLFGFE